VQLTSNCKRLYALKILKFYASKHSLIRLRFHNFVEYKENKTSSLSKFCFDNTNFSTQDN
jgi:hypothetical protein